MGSQKSKTRTLESIQWEEEYGRAFQSIPNQQLDGDGRMAIYFA